ncbi:MAG: HEAT repeat domain-containing protein [Verrucomicrobia bacterium]|nr:HEAT repeat domain-containing protein [Verrucomicrobiota bacterium]
MISARRLTPLLALLSAGTVLAQHPKHPRFGFNVYTNAPSGKQLAGQHKPADHPALSPEESRKAFVVPSGFEVRLFASEPDIANPVAMSWDARGRLWVLELYEYPLGARPGTRGRDRIKILEDTDADGDADQVTVFADGLNLATGLLVANGGVYVGEAPNLWFFEDSNGDDVVDRRIKVLTGFGLEDRHELVNGFTWGPDGQIYMTHGVFTRTEAKNPEAPNAAPVVLTAGVARLDPKTRRFEVFAEGTSNPWGVDFDAHGHAFVSACVIDHLFHLSPGGIYQRQAGQPPHPYGYAELPSIVDHRHHMAAYAGINVYQGDQWPAEWRGAALQGNIHQNALNVDRLAASGATFKASHWNATGDFLTTRDGWFMPVSTQTGPDGAVWIMDWSDRYPCYQNANADPAGVDRERGRIWRVVWTGGETGKAVASRPSRDMDLSRLSSAELAAKLADPNVWQRRTAQRLLNGRGATAFGPRELKARTPLHDQFAGATSLDARLASLWTLHSMGLLDEPWLDTAAADREPAVRAWAARLTGERGYATRDAIARLEKLAADPELTVRTAVAVAARQFVSGALTINTAPKVPVSEVVVGGVLSGLLLNSTRGTDPTFDFLYWMALEPVVAYDPVHAIGFYLQDGARPTWPFSAHLLRKIMRRTCDLRDEAVLGRAVVEFGKIPPDANEALIAGLEGLMEGQRGKVQTPGPDAVAVVTRLAASPHADVAQVAQRVGSLWGDAASVKAALALLTSPGAKDADRIAAIETARKIKSEESRNALLQVAGGANPDAVRTAAIRSLAEVGADDTAGRLLAQWSALPPAARRPVLELCATRSPWKWALFEAVARGDIKRGDVPPSVIRALASSRSDAEKRKAQELFGRVNASSADKVKLIADKRKVVVDGPVDLAAGQEIARKTCLVCHKLHGEGADVGPDLTGVGRSSLEALLHNVVHPNEIIGEGYENVEVETYDGRQLSGRLVENNDLRVRLLNAGPAETVIPKSEIRQMHATENSMMPEGLEQMPDSDFRNLIWYILAPPQDGQPLNEERRRLLIGESGDQAATAPPRDGESAALWAPGWQLDCPEFEGAPARLTEFAGRRDVLMTHPVDGRVPAALVRPLMLPAGQPATLRFAVAPHPQGDWELRVKADGELLHRQTIGHDGAPWKTVKVDLTPFAGRRVILRLENAASDWSYEFGYWADLAIESPERAARD